jgi:TatD DNase family protein
VTIAYEYRPGSLYLNVTNRCSNDCGFCVRQGPGFSLAGFDMRLAREPSAAEVLEAIEEAAAERAAPFHEVVFCGFGEPTYRLDLISEVGRALREQHQWVRLNTNGQAALIAGRDPLPDLEGAVDCVSISMNAPDALTYEALCRPTFGQAAYPAVRAFAEACVGRFPEVVLTVVGFTLSDEDIDRSEAVAERLGAEFRVR